MSDLLNRFIRNATKPVERREPRPEKAWEEHDSVDSVTLAGRTFPLYMGVNLFIPHAPLGYVYNMEQARNMFRTKGIVLRPASALSYNSFRKLIDVEGDVLWLEGAIAVTHKQWVALTTLESRRIVGMLLNPQTAVAQTMPVSCPWIPVNTL